MHAKTRKFVIVLTVAAVPFAAAMVLALSSISGSPVIGVRCTCSSGPARCEVLQSRFLGLIGNTAFAIPEAEIRGARTLRPIPHPGRGSGEYAVSLMLKTDAYSDYLVFHTHFFERADAAAHRLNEYFADPRATSIELREDFSELALLLVPLLLVALAAPLWRLHSAARARADSVR